MSSSLIIGEHSPYRSLRKYFHGINAADLRFLCTRALVENCDPDDRNLMEVFIAKVLQWKITRGPKLVNGTIVDMRGLRDANTGLLKKTPIPALVFPYSPDVQSLDLSKNEIDTR